MQSWSHHIPEEKHSNDRDEDAAVPPSGSQPLHPSLDIPQLFLSTPDPPHASALAISTPFCSSKGEESIGIFSPGQHPPGVRWDLTRQTGTSLILLLHCSHLLFPMDLGLPHPFSSFQKIQRSGSLLQNYHKSPFPQRASLFLHSRFNPDGFGAVCSLETPGRSPGGSTKKEGGKFGGVHGHGMGPS